ncbi:MAG: DUF2817 domain-containing protein [Bdellovibrionales bacterium]|nr:DUF2817 domain-containing protein [Bdellovibrionales bacterium]
MIRDLEKLVLRIDQDNTLQQLVQAQVLSQVTFRQQTYPIYSFTLGNKNPQSPVLFIVGGVHGLERIGSQLAWSLLKSTVDRLIWDQALHLILKNIRLVFLPLLNPVGYLHRIRSNGNGVDLMRNSPIIATEKTPFLLGGHRYSALLPWFQGQQGVLEQETDTLSRFFHQECDQSKCVIALDLHSGFGMKDRIWFPHSYTSKPFEKLAELHALVHLFEQTHPYHIYQIEPQSMGYLLHGDIWDYLYLQLMKKNPHVVFLPLTLEMGSWIWVRKNPIQIFSRFGIFNPIKKHRVKRTYRRHFLFYDFLIKALYSHSSWNLHSSEKKQYHYQKSLERWYPKEIQLNREVREYNELVKS